MFAAWSASPSAAQADESIASSMGRPNMPCGRETAKWFAAAAAKMSRASSS